MQKNRNTGIYFSFIILMICILASPLFAGGYKNRGTIHMPNGSYQPNFGIGYDAQIHSNFVNRSEKVVRYHIDFHYIDNGGSHAVYRYPATGNIVVKDMEAIFRI